MYINAEVKALHFLFLLYIEWVYLEQNLFLYPRVRTLETFHHLVLLSFCKVNNLIKYIPNFCQTINSKPILIVEAHTFHSANTEANLLIINTKFKCSLSFSIANSSRIDQVLNPIYCHPTYY